MIRSVLLCLTAIFIGTSSVQAQQRVCGTTLEQWKELTQQPSYQQRHNQLLQNKSASSNCDTNTIITVPVVVHIVYNTPAQNLSDEQVQSQIDVLNEDYAAINATIMNVPAAWQSMVKDSKIRFCLANRNPQGANTNGITRTFTNISMFNGSDERVKFDTSGGVNAWAASSYLNIWVCNLGGILGFATFPGGAPERDGIVINYKAFGRNDADLNRKYNLGRTATHEIGHWFKMIHVWGDDGGLCENDPGGGTDQIWDTPDQANYTFGSPSYPKYDNCTPGGDGIMFTNYMDYSDDKVMMFFTPRQIEVMDSVLRSPDRDSICLSMGCTLASPLNHDLELTEIVSPVTQTEQRCFHPVVHVRNNGKDTVITFNLVFNIVTGNKRMFKWTGVLFPDSITEITLPSISGTEGLNVLEARIAEVDSNTTNNYRSRSFKVEKENITGCDDCDPLIYPNPVTSNSFCVKSCFTTSDNLTIRVINMLGQKVIELPEVKSNPGDVFPVNMEHQARGVYIVQLINGNQTKGVKLVYLPGDGNYAALSICY